MKVAGATTVASSVFRWNDAVGTAGGGIACWRSNEDPTPLSLDILSSEFHANRARTLSHTGDPAEDPATGGAVAAGAACALDVEEGLLVENRARVGGAIYATYTTVAIVDSDIRENGSAPGSPTWSGGALFVREPPYTMFSVSIINSAVDGNRAEWIGGGAHVECRNSWPNGNTVEPDPTVLLNGVEFAGNVQAGVQPPNIASTQGGGGLDVEGCGLLANSSRWDGNVAFDNGGGALVRWEVFPGSHPAPTSIFVGSVWRENEAGSDGGGLAANAAHVIVKGGCGFAGNSAAVQGGALAGFADGSKPLTVSVTTTGFHENVANADGSAIALSADSVVLQNVLVAENEGPEAAVVLQTPQYLGAPGVMVDIENTTIAGNWIGGAPWYGFPMSANAGLVCKEWSTGFPRGCVGVLTDSVVGWNEVGDPLSWDQHQIYGDQDLVKDGLVAYGHDPVETDVADLMFDPTNAVGPVIGADPGFDGFNTGGPFSAGDPPWTLPFPATYSIYRGAVGGLIDDPMGFTIDKVGAFSGPDDTWCVGIELQTCVPL